MYLESIYLYGYKLNEESTKPFSDSILTQLENEYKESKNQHQNIGKEVKKDPKKVSPKKMSNINEVKRKGMTFIEFEPDYKEILYKYINRRRQQIK